MSKPNRTKFCSYLGWQDISSKSWSSGLNSFPCLQEKKEQLAKKASFWKKKRKIRTRFSKWASFPFLKWYGSQRKIQRWGGGPWSTNYIKGSSVLFSNNKNLQPNSGVFRKGSLWWSSSNNITSCQGGCRNWHLGKARWVSTGFSLGHALCRSPSNCIWVRKSGVRLKLSRKVRQRCWTGASRLEHWAPQRILNLLPCAQSSAPMDLLTMLWEQTLVWWVLPSSVLTTWLSCQYVETEQYFHMYLSDDGKKFWTCPADRRPHGFPHPYNIALLWTDCGSLTLR